MSESWAVTTEAIEALDDFVNRPPSFARPASMYGDIAPLPPAEPVDFLRVDDQPIVHHEAVIICINDKPPPAYTFDLRGPDHKSRNRRRAAARYRARERRRHPSVKSTFNYALAIADIAAMLCQPNEIMEDLWREPRDGGPLGDKKPELAAPDVPALAAVPVAASPEPATELPACWCGMRKGEKAATATYS